jgi:hypothetical protein
MSSFEIDLNDNYLQENINERLYRNIIEYHDDIDKVEYFKDKQKYIVHTKSNYKNRDKDIFIGKHFKINHDKKHFYRYNYFEFEISDFLRDNFIKNKMSMLYNFITDQNINKIIVRSVDDIKIGFYKNVISNYVSDLLDNSYFSDNIIDTIIILGLIKKLNNDEIKETHYDISINNNFMTNLIRIFEKQDMSLFKIDEIIYDKLYEVKNLPTLTIFKNIIFTDHNSKFYKNLYEFKFVYTFINLIANTIQYNQKEKF